MHRFFVPDLADEGALVELPDDEARHLIQVLRLALGDEVRVFDGRGREHVARVESSSRRRAEVRVGRAAAPAPEPSVRVTLAASLLKGDKFDDVVRDATMLGVACVLPLVTARTEVPAARAGKVSRVDRWQRVALSAAKQSGRAVVPDVRGPMRLDEAMSACPPPLIVLAEPSAAAARSPLPPAPPEASVLIGPEGGWTPEELSALAAAGASFLQVGGRTLRADAVPLVALTALLWEWKAL